MNEINLLLYILVGLRYNNLKGVSKDGNCKRNRNGIKNARLTVGITQAELAHRLGVTPQAISQYERGIKKPKIETIEK